MYLHEVSPALLGFSALLLCAVAFVVWLFVLLALTPLWRQSTRPRRRAAMRAIVIVMLLASIAAVIGVPTETLEFHNYRPVPVSIQTAPIAAPASFTHTRHWGVTRWLRLEEYAPPFPPREITWRIDPVGAVAILPSIIILVLGARWLWRWLPGMYRLPEHECDTCAYDLRGCAPPRCPECGEEIS